MHRRAFLGLTAAAVDPGPCRRGASGQRAGLRRGRRRHPRRRRGGVFRRARPGRRARHRAGGLARSDLALRDASQPTGIRVEPAPLCPALRRVLRLHVVTGAAWADRPARLTRSSTGGCTCSVRSSSERLGARTSSRTSGWRRVIGQWRWGDDAPFTNVSPGVQPSGATPMLCARDGGSEHRRPFHCPSFRDWRPISYRAPFSFGFLRQWREPRDSQAARHVGRRIPFLRMPLAAPARQRASIGAMRPSHDELRRILSRTKVIASLASRRTRSGPAITSRATCP